MSKPAKPESRWKLSGSFRDPKRFHWAMEGWIFSEAEALACFESRKKESGKITLIRMDRLPSGQWGHRHVVKKCGDDTANPIPENQVALANSREEKTPKTPDFSRPGYSQAEP